jgi:hypothetical protein
MVKKKYRRIGKRLFKPMPGAPALYYEVGKSGRYSDMQLDAISIASHKRAAKKLFDKGKKYI